MSDNAVAASCSCATRYYSEHDKTEFVRVDSERSHYVDCPLAAHIVNAPSAPNELDLAPIEARVEAATSGEWKVYDGNKFTEIAVEGGERLLMVARVYRSGRANGTAYRMPDLANAAFIANAKADQRALIAEVKRLRRWKAEAMEVLSGYDKIAELAGGKLGSSKVSNLEAYVNRLRAENERLRAELDEWRAVRNEE